MCKTRPKIAINYNESKEMKKKKLKRGRKLAAMASIVVTGQCEMRKSKCATKEK